MVVSRLSATVASSAASGDVAACGASCWATRRLARGGRRRAPRGRTRAARRWFDADTPEQRREYGGDQPTGRHEQRHLGDGGAGWHRYAELDDQRPARGRDEWDRLYRGALGRRQ